MTRPGHSSFPSSGNTWRPERRSPWPLLIPTAVVLVTVVALYAISRRLAPPPNRLVVVYTSQDQVYAEPLLRDFERESGIAVRAVFDSEAVKTVGLVNRLIAEAPHPQCDVFWNNEELRTWQLAERGALDEQSPWKALGHRSRRIVLNTNLVAVANAPHSLLQLTNRIWQGRVALAYPLFGTTATHFLSLQQHWGDTAWRQWCRALQANQPFVVDGNSVVVRLVGQGEAALGLTDSDDIAAGRREGYPIVALPLTTESLSIPNTVAVIRQAPHPLAARQFIEYLQRPETLTRLVEAQALESIEDPADAEGLRPDWPRLIAELPANTDFLREVFLR